MADFIGFDISSGLNNMANNWSQGYRDARDLAKYEQQLAMEEDQLKQKKGIAAQEAATKYGLHDKESLQKSGGNYIDVDTSLEGLEPGSDEYEMRKMLKSKVNAYKGLLKDKMEINGDQVSLHPYAAEQIMDAIRKEQEANLYMSKLKATEAGKNYRASLGNQKLPAGLQQQVDVMKTQLKGMDNLLGKVSSDISAGIGYAQQRGIQLEQVPQALAQERSQLNEQLNKLLVGTPGAKVAPQQQSDPEIIVVAPNGQKARARASQLQGLIQKGYKEAGK